MYQCKKWRVGATVVVVVGALVISRGGSAEISETLSKNAPTSQLVERANGAFTTRVDIEAPKFFGLEPRLALEYVSGQPNGPLGHGFRIAGLSVIERAGPAGGLPQYLETDTFTLDGERLVAVENAGPACAALAGATGTHCTRSLQYVRITRDTSDNSWTVTDTKGVRTIYRPMITIDSGTFRWGMSEVVDPLGNTVFYSYNACNASCASDPMRYLSRISYQPTSEPYARIEFHWEDRSDPVPIATGASILQTAKRLQSVIVSIQNGTPLRFPVRGYALRYRESLGQPATLTGSFLTEIRQYGNNLGRNAATGTLSGPFLPPTVFEWDDGVSGRFGESQIGTIKAPLRAGQYSFVDAQGNGHGQFVNYIDDGIWAGPTQIAVMREVTFPGLTHIVKTFTDITGDGRADAVVHAARTTAVVDLSTGTRLGGHHPELNGGLVCQMAFGDINGDGKSDFVFVRTRNPTPGDECEHDKVFYGISDGVSFNVMPGLPLAYQPQPGSLQIVDINNDGRGDIVYKERANEAPPSSDTHVRMRLNISTDSNIAFGPDTIRGFLATSSQSNAMALADVNGDGMPDIVYRARDTNDIRVLLSNGSGFASDQLWVTTSAAIHKHTIGFIDANGDRMADVVFVDPNKQAWIHFSTGSRFEAKAFHAGQLSDLPHDLGGRTGAWTFGDTNGDSAIDFVYALNNDVVKTIRGDNVRPPRIVGIRNGHGGHTSIGYQWTKASGANDPFFALLTAETVTVSDGRTAPGATTYSYDNGKYHRGEQRFLGFAYQRIAKPCVGDVCAVQETWSSHALGSLGKPIATRECGYPSGNFIGDGDRLRAEMRYYSDVTYDSGAVLPDNSGGLPYVGQLTKRRTYEYQKDSASCARQTSNEIPLTLAHGVYQEAVTEYEYDDYGNTVVEHNRGIESIASDDVTTTTRYAYNASKFLVGYPGWIELASAAGTVRSHAVFYDDASEWTSPPSQGLATARLDKLIGENRWIVSRYTHDDFGNVRTETNGAGLVKTFTYGGAHPLFRTSVRNEAFVEQTQTWSYRCGLPATTTDANDQATTTIYDAHCRPKETRRPLGGYEKVTYCAPEESSVIGTGSCAADNRHIELRRSGPDGKELVQKRFFDGLHRVWRTVTGPQNAIVEIGFDTAGRKAWETAPYYNGEKARYTRYEYDALGRETLHEFGQRDTAGVSTRTTHYNVALVPTQEEAATPLRVVESIDELCHARRDFLDVRGNRVLQVVVASDNGDSACDTPLSGTKVRTVFRYDTVGNLVQVVDAQKNLWKFGYDSLGRKTWEFDPDHGYQQHRYDDANRLVASVDAKGQGTAIVYGSAVDRVKRRIVGLDSSILGSYPTITPRVDAKEYLYSYDVPTTGYFTKGRLTSVVARTYVSATNTQDTEIKRYFYDAEGRVARVDSDIDDLSMTFTTKYHLDGSIAQETYPDETLRYDYDDSGRLKSLSVGDTLLLHSATYTADDKLRTIVSDNGLTTTNTYSQRRGLLKTRSIGGTGQQLSDSITYVYDAAGKIEEQQTSDAKRSWRYDYDSLGRLTVATRADRTNAPETFRYDAINNLIGSSTVGCYGYGAVGASGRRGNQPHAVTSTFPPHATRTQSLVYDAAGNLKNRHDHDLVYDAEHRLVEYRGAKSWYGAEGQRVKYVSATDKVSYYPLPGYEIHDGMITKYITFGSVTVKRSGTAASGAESRTNEWMYSDARGSIVAVANDLGREIQRITYGPFGDIRSRSSDEFMDQRGYIGQHHDDTGLMYLNARHYDPALHRFITPDPTDIMRRGVGLNRFSYSLNDPINLRDPSGLSAFDFGGPFESEFFEMGGFGAEGPSNFAVVQFEPMTSFAQRPSQRLRADDFNDSMADNPFDALMGSLAERVLMGIPDSHLQIAQTVLNSVQGEARKLFGGVSVQTDGDIKLNLGRVGVKHNVTTNETISELDLGLAAIQNSSAGILSVEFKTKRAKDKVGAGVNVRGNKSVLDWGSVADDIITAIGHRRFDLYDGFDFGSYSFGLLNNPTNPRGTNYTRRFYPETP